MDSKKLLTPDTFVAGDDPMGDLPTGGGTSGAPDVSGAGSALGGMAGEAIGTKIGGEAGAAVGKTVGQAVASGILGSGLAGLTGGSSSPLDVSTGGFAGPLDDGPQQYFPLKNPGGLASGIADAVSDLFGGGASLPANATWFNFATSGGPFAVYEFDGVEEVHKPYEFTIELVSSSPSVDITSLVGQTGCLTVMDKSGEVRPIHGVIRQMEQLHTSNNFTHYRCSLVPRLWFLDKIIDHRIFQNKKVDEIIEQILKEQGFAGETFEFALSQEYEPREYCVQYGESDLHFISRLCEEEGIYFYFEHTEQSHKLCFCDKENGPPIPGNSMLRYYRGSGNVPDTAVVSAVSLCQSVNSNATAYREWNFKKPNLDQEVKKDETDPKKAPVPEGMLLEQYRYPHLYREPQKGGEPGTPGQQYADVQLLRQLTCSRVVTGETDISRLVPSFVFTLSQHPRADMNAQWWVVRTEHYGQQPGVLQDEAPGERGLHYKAAFSAIPAETRFVPALEHPKRRALGDQTAIVTGPEGEEIYPDKYGRVKVQFFWDREGKWDENTTCWIRVSQGWAGSTYGAMAIPRIGHEVVVRFLEGDPDRPLITGRVYHDMNMPPYELPKHKTRTVFKSMSTPGEKNEPRGYNELRIEDKKDNEEIYIHAEKDVNIFVKNDWKEHILHDKHETIDASRYTHIKGEEHLLVEKDRMTELKEEDHFTIHNDSHSEYKTKWLAKAGEEIHFKSGDKIVIEAASDMTVKGGDSFIRLTPAGIVILGAQVKINEGGSPGSGSGAAPVLPEEAVKPGEAPKPKRTGLELKDGEDPLATAADSSTEHRADMSEGPMDAEEGHWGKQPKRCEYLMGPPIARQDWFTAQMKERAAALGEARKDAGKLLKGSGDIAAIYKNNAQTVASQKTFLDKIATAEKLGNQKKYYWESQDPNRAQHLASRNIDKSNDIWLTPSEFLAPRPGGGARGGDCEDFAIYKYTLLENASVSPENMEIVTLRPKDGKGPKHAVLVVTDPDTKQRYVLDNNRTNTPAMKFPNYDKNYEPEWSVSDKRVCEFYICIFYVIIAMLMYPQCTANCEDSGMIWNYSISGIPPRGIVESYLCKLNDSYLLVCHNDSTDGYPFISVSYDGRLISHGKYIWMLPSRSASGENSTLISGFYNGPPPISNIMLYSRANKTLAPLPISHSISDVVYVGGTDQGYFLVSALPDFFEATASPPTGILLGIDERGNILFEKSFAKKGYWVHNFLNIEGNIFALITNKETFMLIQITSSGDIISECDIYNKLYKNLTPLSDLFILDSDVCFFVRDENTNTNFLVKYSSAQDELALTNSSGLALYNSYIRPISNKEIGIVDKGDISILSANLVFIEKYNSKDILQFIETDSGDFIISGTIADRNNTANAFIGMVRRSSFVASHLMSAKPLHAGFAR